MRIPKRKPIEPRPLSGQELCWIREIIENNPLWPDFDLNDTNVIAECDCGKCGTVYLRSSSPQNPRLTGTTGYIGRIEIITADDFMITITLDQCGGSLVELFVDALDLREPGNRL